MQGRPDGYERVSGQKERGGEGLPLHHVPSWWWRRWIKTITLRPKLNRFIVNSNFYQRNEVSAAFVVKKQFSDKGAEALAFLHGREEDTVEDVHAYIRQQVTECRSDKVDCLHRGHGYVQQDAPVDGQGHRAVYLMFLDQPRLGAVRPYRHRPLLQLRGHLQPGLHQAQVRLSPPDQLGHLLAVLHHRREKEIAVLSTRTAPVTMRETLELGLTIDERLADGYYYSKSVRLLEYLLDTPGGAGKAHERGGTI